VSHGEDLFFLFCPEVAKAMNLSLPKPGTDDYMMINYFTQMWTDFAKTGYKNFFFYFVENIFRHILIINSNRFLEIQRLLQIHGYH